MAYWNHLRERLDEPRWLRVRAVLYTLIVIVLLALLAGRGGQNVVYQNF